MIYEKDTLSGKLLEIDFYPAFNNGNRLPVREPGRKRSTEEQQKYNRVQATKKLIRLVNTNFTEDDFYIHPTFTEENEPADEKQARKEINNFFRRVKRYRQNKLKRLEIQYSYAKDEQKKNPNSKVIQQRVNEIKAEIRQLKKDFKYIYCIEKVNKWHFHLFMAGGGLTMKEIRTLWGKGRIKGDKYNPQEFGPEAAASYMGKDPKGRKSFAYSKNLKKPKQPKPKPRAFARKRYEKMATELVDDKDYWEKRHNGYRFLRCYSRQNPYNGHYYISVVMYQNTSSPPQWNIEAEDWLTGDY